MRIRLFFTIAILFAFTIIVKAQNLQELNGNISIDKIEDFKIIRFSNDFELLKEFKTSDLSVRVIALGNNSGSAGFDNGEITSDLYFAVSEFDEYPKQNLFRVSDFYEPKIESVDTTNNLRPVIEISFGQSGKRQKIKFELTINELKTSR